MKLTLLKKLDPFILLTGERDQLSIMRRDLNPALIPERAAQETGDAQPSGRRTPDSGGLIPDADPGDIVRSQGVLLGKIRREAGFNDETFRDIITPVLIRAASCTGLLLQVTRSTTPGREGSSASRSRERSSRQGFSGAMSSARQRIRANVPRSRGGSPRPACSHPLPGRSRASPPKPRLKAQTGRSAGIPLPCPSMSGASRTVSGNTAPLSHQSADQTAPRLPRDS